MTVPEIAAYLLAGVLLLGLCLIFRRPLKAVFIMMIHSVFGGLGLYIFNFVCAGIGFSIGLNMVTASVCGLFGLPGLVLLILLKILFGDTAQ